MRRFATTLAVAASTLIALTTAAAPAAAAVVSYRVDLYAGYAAWAFQSYNANLTTALVTDVARVFGTSASAVTVNDCIVTQDAQYNISAVVTVNGGSDTAFLASPRDAVASWTNATNDLLYQLWWMDSREAAAAAFSFSGDWKMAYISSVARVDAGLPNSRFLEVTLYGKHLVTAAVNPDWNDSLVLDLAEAFSFMPSELGDAIAITRITLTSFNSSGVNGSTLTVRFTVHPLLDASIITTTFFASSGVVSWLSRCTNVHNTATYIDLGLPVPFGRGAAALVDMTDEMALTVTGTSVAPGDQAYTNAPGSVTNAPATNAPGGAAAGVTGFAAAAAVALVCASMALF